MQPLNGAFLDRTASASPCPCFVVETGCPVRGASPFAEVDTAQGDLSVATPRPVPEGAIVAPTVSSTCSVRQRDQLLREASHRLYRWYLSRSQQTRNWNPDDSFNWSSFEHETDEKLIRTIEGFFAVEQYAPDYTSELVKLSRADYGQSQFHIRWGAEEQRHADVWRNILLHSGAQTAVQIDDLVCELREAHWSVPFESSTEMLFYTVLQERATQLIYQKTARYVRCREGQRECSPLLAAINAVAGDEGAHYGFFLSLARLNLFYRPEIAVPALVKVARNFVMPASDIVRGYQEFVAALHSCKIFGPAIYGKEVAKPTLEALGVESLRELELQLAARSLSDGSRPASKAGLSTSSRLTNGLRALFSRLELGDLQAHPLKPQMGGPND